MFKLKSTKYFIAAATAIVFFVSVIFDWYILAILSLLSAFVLFTICIYKYNGECVKKEYNEFADMSKFIVGMPKEEVEMLNSNYAVTRIDETNEALSGICDTCGGKVVDGVCIYCGNKYDDSTKVTSLIYSTAYGQRTFTFKGNKLTNTKIWLRPL